MQILGKGYDVKKPFGVSDAHVRAKIDVVTSSQKISLGKLFEAAAAKHAPHLRPREIERKLGRYLEGSAPPAFVAAHVHELVA